jgi:L-rhamnose-H+ transport protein
MNLGIGILLVVAGGALEGLFSLPVTRTPRWQWENIWGLGSLIALILVPWPVALLTVPELGSVFSSVDPNVLVWTFLFGVGWGVGGIFWGKAIAAVGMALGISLLMGLLNVFGSPILLAFTEGPAKLAEPGGIMLLVAVAVMVLGVTLCAVAGNAKQRDLLTDAGEGGASTATPFAVGLMFCAVSAILSAMVNFGFVYGEPIKQAAIKANVSVAAAPNAIWALVFTGNYLVNTVYAFALMLKRGTTGRLLKEGSTVYCLWALFMGLAWPLGIVFYGMGADRMGRYGAFVAFPMMLVMAILFGNLAGILTGEWRGVSARTKATMFVGIVVLVQAFAVFGMASMFLANL